MRRAYQQFTWRHVAAELANIYESAIEPIGVYATQALAASGEMSLRS
jgi:hypothetical protein